MRSDVDDFDINDVFDSLVSAEESVVESGYTEGEQKGRTEGELEGYHLGYHRGAEVGSEVGYYLGFAGYHLKFSPTARNTPKIGTVLTKLTTLAQSVPKTNDTNVEILAILEECRATYKKACIHLKTSPRLPNPVAD